MTASCMVPMLRHGRPVVNPSPASHHPAKPRHALIRFAGVGGVATAIQLGLFAALLTVLPQLWANVISWTVSTVVANAANRSVTFGVHGSEGAQRDFLVSGAFSALSLLASVAVLNEVGSDGSLQAVLALVAVNAAVGLARFAGLRWWFVSKSHAVTA